MSNSEQISTADFISQVAGEATEEAASTPEPETNPVEETTGESDGEEKSPEEGQKDTESPEEGLSVEEKKAEEGNPKPSPVIFKAKLGDKDLDLDGEATVTIKIDKKDETVALKDLIRQYQGKIPLEKHYGALKKDRTDFEAEKKTFLEEKGVVESRMKELVELLRTDPRKALEKIVLYSGANPGDYESIYAADVQDMDEREKALFLREKRLEHQEAQAKLAKEKFEAESKKQETAQAVTNALIEGQKKFNLSDDEIRAGWNYTLELSKAGKLDLSKLSGEQIGSTVVQHIMDNVRPIAIFEKAAKDVGFAGEVTSEDVKFLKTLLYPGIEWADIADIVKAYYNLSDNGSAAKHTQAKESSKERATKPTFPKTPQRPEVEDTEDEDEDDDPKSFEDLFSRRRRGRR